MTRTIFFFVIFSIQHFSQSMLDSTYALENNLQKRFFTNSFSTQLNTFYLLNKLSYNASDEKYFFRFDEEYTSTLVKSTEKSIKDEQEFQLAGGYKLNPFLSFGLIGKSSIFSDSRKIEINSASMNSGFLFVKIDPYENLFLAAKGGISDNRQIGEHDLGASYGFESGFNHLTQSDLIIKTFASALNEDISPRKNYNRNLRLILTNQFGTEISNSLQVRFNQFRKDFYYQADSITQSDFKVINNIQGRIETEYRLENNFAYRNIFGGIDLSFSGLVNFREIEKNTRYKSQNVNSASLFNAQVDELFLNAASTIDYQSANAASSFQFLYQQRDEKYRAEFYEGANILFFNQSAERENQKNNLTERITLSSNSHFSFSSSDKLELHVSHNKLKFDTPSQNNFDDRDELLSIIRVKYMHKFNSLLSLFVQTEGNIGRLAYISAQKSSNNYINRVAKLSSGGSISSKSLFSHNIFEVVANYTVYDYEDINPNYKSYSFRQFGFIDSTSISLTRAVSLRFNGYLRISEQAELNWNSFTIKPIRFLEEIFFTPYLHTTKGQFEFSLGLRNFSLKTYFFSGSTKIIQSYYSSIGPFSSIIHNSSGKIQFRVAGWREFINRGRSDASQLTTFSMSILWNF